MLARLGRAAGAFGFGMLAATLLTAVFDPLRKPLVDGLSSSASFVIWTDAVNQWFPVMVMISVIVLLLAGAVAEGRLGGGSR